MKRLRALASCLSPHDGLRGGGLETHASRRAHRAECARWQQRPRRAGVPDYEATTWNGVAAPAKTPSVIITAINHELARLLAQPEVSETFLEQGTQPQSSTPEAFGNKIKAEITQWSTLAKTIGLQLE